MGRVFVLLILMLACIQMASALAQDEPVDPAPNQKTTQQDQLSAPKEQNTSQQVIIQTLTAENATLQKRVSALEATLTRPLVVDDDAFLAAREKLRDDGYQSLSIALTYSLGGLALLTAIAGIGFPLLQARRMEATVKDSIERAERDLERVKGDAQSIAEKTASTIADQVLEEKKLQAEELIADLDARIKTANQELDKVQEKGEELEGLITKINSGAGLTSEEEKSLKSKSSQAQKKEIQDRSVDDWVSIIWELIREKYYQLALDSTATLRTLHSSDESIAESFFAEGYIYGRDWKKYSIQNAIDAYDRVIDKFFTSDDPKLAMIAAQSAFNKGIAIMKVGPDQDIKAAIALYDKVIEAHQNSDDKELIGEVIWAFYNRACAHAVLGDVQSSVKDLEFWADNSGFFDCDRVQKDDDFANIRDEALFKDLLAKHGCLAEPSGKP